MYIFPANIFLADVVSTRIRISRRIHEISDVKYYSRVDTHTVRFQASGNVVWDGVVEEEIRWSS